MFACVYAVAKTSSTIPPLLTVTWATSLSWSPNSGTTWSSAFPGAALHSSTSGTRAVLSSSPCSPTVASGSSASTRAQLGFLTRATSSGVYATLFGSCSCSFNRILARSSSTYWRLAWGPVLSIVEYTKWCERQSPTHASAKAKWIKQ